MAEIAVTNCAKLEDYKQAVLHAGGEVRIVEHGTPVAAALEGVGGLLLTGGEDVAPALYGEAKHWPDLPMARPSWARGLAPTGWAASRWRSSRSQHSGAARRPRLPRGFRAP